MQYLRKKFNVMNLRCIFCGSVSLLLFVCSMFIFSPNLGAEDFISSLRQEARDAAIIANRLRASADRIDDNFHIGSGMNEVDVREHSCYVLGVLLGQRGAVQHLKLHRKPSFRASSSDDAYDLRVKAQSLDNFIHVNKIISGLSATERAIQWNIDCVGQLVTKGRSIDIVGSKSFFRIEGNGKVLVIMGDIEFGFAERIKSIIARYPDIDTVALGSGGGAVYEAMLAGLYIREKGLDTVLWNACHSACPLVFLGGVKRIVWSPYPPIGFHKISDKSGAVPNSAPVYDDIFNFVKKMGADARFVVSQMHRAEPDEMVLIRADAILCEKRIATWIQRAC